MQIEENRLRKEKEKKLRELEDERIEMRARQEQADQLYKMEQERKILEDQKARLRKEQQELVEIDLIQRRKQEEDEKLMRRLGRR